MTMEKSLYAQVVKLRRKDLKCFETDKNTNKAKLMFQGQSSIAQIWFDIDLDWMEINFSYHEPNFYKETFKKP